jgi:hypothetical protein
MYKEVVVGVPHLIENEQPNEHKRNESSRKVRNVGRPQPSGLSVDFTVVLCVAIECPHFSAAYFVPIRHDTCGAHLFRRGRNLERDDFSKTVGLDPSSTWGRGHASAQWLVPSESRSQQRRNYSPTHQTSEDVERQSRKRTKSAHDVKSNPTRANRRPVIGRVLD